MNYCKLGIVFCEGLGLASPERRYIVLEVIIYFVFSQYKYS